MSDAEKKMTKKGDTTRFQALLQSVYEAVLITDLQGKIVEANARTTELFLVEAEELKKKALSDLISGFDEKILKNVTDALNSRKHIIVDGSCVRQDGTIFPAEIAANSLNLGSEKLLCFSIRDVSSRQQTEAKLQKVQEDLVRMEKIKARMDTITTLAHEINNPLQMLLSMVESDNNIRYAAPLNRIVAVMQEMRRDEELKTIKYAGTSHRFEVLTPDIVRAREKHIMVVDDEPTLVRFFQSILLDDIPGVTVDCAANGAEAIASFHIKHHSVLILDISMPVMNGEETFNELKRICKEKKWEMPAIIFCTGFTPPPSIMEAISGDNQHCYLPKPVSRESLVNAVRNRLEYYDLSHPKA